MKNSIEVEVPKDINHYQSKVMFGFSLRQLLSVVWVAFVVIPTYIFLNLALGVEGHLLNLIIMTLAIPPLAWGFIRKDGMNFEQLLKVKYKSIKSREIRLLVTDRSCIETKTKRKQKKQTVYNEGAEYEFKYDIKKTRKEAKHKVKQAKKQKRIAKRNKKRAEKA